MTIDQEQAGNAFKQGFDGAKGSIEERIDAGLQSLSEHLSGQISTRMDNILANKKARLFSEHATVAAISLAPEASIEHNVDGVKTRQEFKPGDLQTAFLQALDQKGTKYEVISRDDLSLVFAVARDKYAEIQETIREFFAGERGLALISSSTMQSFDNSLFGPLKNKLLSLVDSERRDVGKAVTRLNIG